MRCCIGFEGRPKLRRCRCIAPKLKLRQCGILCRLDVAKARTTHCRRECRTTLWPYILGRQASLADGCALCLDSSRSVLRFACSASLADASRHALTLCG